MARWAIWLGVVAVLVRCVIGAGVMPDMRALANGTFTLVICTGDGAKISPAAPDDTGGGDHAGDICPFSAAAHLAIPAQAPAIIAGPFQHALPAAPARAWRHPGLAHALRARAPPTLS